MALAVGVEMLHNAFLVHDDVSDGSRLRRGGPSLPEQVGVGLSVCAGDALAVEAMAVLREAAGPLPKPRPRRARARSTRPSGARSRGRRSNSAGTDDGRLDVTVADYLDMVLRKTSWYSVILPCRLGCLAAGRRPAGAAAIRAVRFAARARSCRSGTTSWASPPPPNAPARTGATTCSRASEACPSSIASPPRRGRTGPGFAGCWRGAREARTRDDARWVTDLLDRHGGFDFARRCASGLAAAARDELGRELAGVPHSPQAALLSDLVGHLEARAASADVAAVAAQAGPARRAGPADGGVQLDRALRS